MLWKNMTVDQYFHIESTAHLTPDSCLSSVNSLTRRDDFRLFNFDNSYELD